MTDDARPGWSRPPFEPGNVVALKHGARSPRLIEPEAAALVDAVLADPDLAYLRAQKWRPTLENWARAQRAADRFGAYLEAMPVEKQAMPPRGGAKSPIDQWLGMVRAATGLADRLGLTPTSAARLSRDMSASSYMQGLTSDHPLIAALDAKQRARELAAGAPDEDDDDG